MRLKPKNSTGQIFSLLLGTLFFSAAHFGHATGPSPAGASSAASPRQQVETHATVRSIFEEDGGRRIYIRLKLAQLDNKPFPVLTYRVTDRAMLAGIGEGSSVAFTAARAGGENTIISLRAAEPCLRSQPCK
jgi:Cu/Ag efflux protein CusF